MGDRGERESVQRPAAGFVSDPECRRSYYILLLRTAGRLFGRFAYLSCIAYREKDDYEGGEEFQVSLNQEAEAPAPNKDRGSAVGGGRRGKGEFHTPSKKRKARDEKFGFGGSKKLKKQNDAMSSGDMDGYRGSFREGRGTRGGRGGKGGKSIRPGKSKRAKQKAK